MYKYETLSLKIAIPLGLLLNTLGTTLLLMGAQVFIIGIVDIFINNDITSTLVACVLGSGLFLGGLLALGAFFPSMGLDQVDDSKIRRLLGIILGIILWYLIMG